MFPSGEPVPGGHLEWTGDQDPLPQFLEFLFSGDPWPKTVVGPIAVSMTYRFLWRNPDSLKPLQEQCEGHLTATDVSGTPSLFRSKDEASCSRSCGFHMVLVIHGWPI